MRIFIDKRETFLLHIALLKLKTSYPVTYGEEAQRLIDKIILATQLQKSGKGMIRMPSNARVIEMELEAMLRETGQIGNVKWGPVIGYCIGYYKEVTMDHIIAVQELESRGLILR